MTRRVAVNAVWNVGGQLVSAGIGLVALPWLLALLGPARLGLFTLALGLIGFSGLFDLGLSRALTQVVSSALGEGRPRDIVAATTWRVIGLLVLCGCVWSGLVWWATPHLVGWADSLKGALAVEATLGLHAMALSIPFALGATGAAGALQGLQKFRLLNAWRMPLTVLQFGLPIAAAALTADAGWVIAALAVTRVVSFALWARLLHGFLPWSRSGRGNREDFGRALRFGGWLSVSNLIGPIMVYADRFYLASLFPPAAVAHYTVPFDVTVRVTSLPQTAMNALFPALAEERLRPERSEEPVLVSFQAMLAILLPGLVTVALFAHTLLSWWLDPAFAASATPVLQALLLGVLFNAAAHPPYAFLQALGRSDLTAKLHLVELPLFAFLLVGLVKAFGMPGAALAWSARVAIDAVLLFLTAAALHPGMRRVLGLSSIWLSVAAGILIVVILEPRALVSWALAFLIWAVCARMLVRLWRRWQKAGGNGP